MPPAPATPDSHVADLMRRVKQFDADAWADLVALGTPWVYCWCRGAGVEPQEAADIVQRVFDGVSRAIGNFRREVTVSGLKEWWWSVTRNKIKAYYQRCYDEAAARERVEDLPELPPADPELADTGSPPIASSQAAARAAYAGEAELQAAVTRILQIGRDPTTHERRRQQRKSRHRKDGV